LLETSHQVALEDAAAAAALYDEKPTLENEVAINYNQYMVSIHVRGEATVEKAKERGALSFTELYPEVKLVSLNKYAARFYKKPTDIPS
jgi:hypothetical protein